jgi:ketosteroid isomerase-like protein
MSEESTPPDLVELTRCAIETAAKWAADPDRSPEGLDAYLAVYGPDSVWDMSAGGMGVFKGPEAIRRFFEDWVGAYDDYQSELEQIDDFGGGVVFGVSHLRGRPQGTTGYVDLRFASVNEWDDGRIARVTNYLDVDEARAAAERLAKERG